MSQRSDRHMRNLLLARLSKRSIRMNGVLIPVEGADTALGRFADHLVERTDHEIFRFSLAGSTALIAYRGRYIAVCTRHQLKSRKLEEIGLIVRDGESVVTSGGQTHFSQGSVSDFTDIAAFDFTKPCIAGALDTRRFFPLLELPPDASSDAVAFIVCAGFPYNAQRYELEENHLGSTKMLAVCVPAGGSNDPALLRLKPVQSLPVEPDGMSGGSAFACIVVGGEARVFFAGIVTRANLNTVYVVKAGFVVQFLDSVINIR
jgi:hypothetical protein